MIELSAKSSDRIASPPLVPAEPPAPAEAVLDAAHLARMTLGDCSLQQEVLALFNRQAELLLARMHDVAPAGVATLAHTLQGSARGIGAWQVAKAAEAVERVAGGNDRMELTRMVRRLAAVIDETKAAIEQLLAAG
jgi:HPt (histidine-containing phosphotransfer) domain-containing protein